MGLIETRPQDVLDEAQQARLVQLASELRWRQPAIAFTGAGISTESGIPDYRGPSGLWKRSQPITFKAFLADPALQREAWERRRTRYPVLAAAEPNAGHVALRRLQEAGYIEEIITQNIDGLHQKAGSPPESVVELHGTIHAIHCLDCGTRFPAEEFDPGPPGTIPACPDCGGTVKEATVAFGQSLNVEDLKRALALAREASLMVVVGSSLSVNPAAKVPQVAAASGALLAIVNNEPTPLDERADIVVRAPAGAALAFLADLLGA